MDFTPENEMGVVVYFAQKYPSIQQIGIVLLKVQSNFPDAIIMVGSTE